MDDLTKITAWQPIATALKDRRIALLIPYERSIFTEEECTDEGEWDIEASCFRFDGDDSPQDIQPTHWRECEENV